MDTYWTQFSNIPFKVFCNMHHLSNDIFQLLQMNEKKNDTI